MSLCRVCSSLALSMEGRLMASPRRLEASLLPRCLSPDPSRPPHPNRLPAPLPNPNRSCPPCPLLDPLVTRPLPPSWSISIASSSAAYPLLDSDPRLPAPFSSPSCTSTARSFLRLSFSRCTASALTFSACASRSVSAAAHRWLHVDSVCCSAGSEPGARSRSGAREVTLTRERAGSSVAVRRPA